MKRAELLRVCVEISITRICASSSILECIEALQCRRYIIMLKFHKTPFHVTHDDEKASKMAMKMDLSIMLAFLIKEKGWTQ